MKTKELNAKLIEADTIEKTVSIANAVECDEALFFTTANGTQDKALLLNRVEFGEIGYERKSDWTRFVNKLNSYNDTPIKRPTRTPTKIPLDR